MRRSALVAALALIATACSPPSDDDAGLDRFSTDVVMGAQSKPAIPAPVPVAELSPAFPSFLVPSPPPVQTVELPSGAVSLPPAPPPPPAPRRCRQADVNTIPPKAAPDLSGPPAEGAYLYRQSGAFTVGGKRTELPGTVERVVTNVRRSTDGGASYDIRVAQLGTVTTTSYSVVRVPASTETNGIYVTRIVMALGNGTVQDFQPAPPGLRLFPLPAATATTWTSVATDPIHGISASLDGVVTTPSRVDACGDLVEGWETKAKISMTAAATPEVARSTTIDAVYVVVPQLGGLVVSDRVVLAGTDKGVPVRQETDVLITALRPTRPA